MWYVLYTYSYTHPEEAINDERGSKKGRQKKQKEPNPLLFFPDGVLNSAVGMSCSPGLTHNMGPSSLLFLLGIWSTDSGPHGKVLRRNGFCSKRSE